MAHVTLKNTTDKDLKTLFVFQSDPEANFIAGFTVDDPGDRDAYLEKWTKIIHHPSINVQSIWLEDELVGSIGHYDVDGETNVSYWIDKAYWGKGIATEALRAFLMKVRRRPLVGRAAFDNTGSQKVLTRCGFKLMNTEYNFAKARKKSIEEYVFVLD